MGSVSPTRMSDRMPGSQLPRPRRHDARHRVSRAHPGASSMWGEVPALRPARRESIWQARGSRSTHLRVFSRTPRLLTDGTVLVHDANRPSLSSAFGGANWYRLTPDSHDGERRFWTRDLNMPEVRERARHQPTAGVPPDGRVYGTRTSSAGKYRLRPARARVQRLRQFLLTDLASAAGRLPSLRSGVKGQARRLAGTVAAQGS
jgi:hypothetical protein